MPIGPPDGTGVNVTKGRDCMTMFFAIDFAVASQNLEKFGNQVLQQLQDCGATLQELSQCSYAWFPKCTALSIRLMKVFW